MVLLLRVVCPSNEWVQCSSVYATSVGAAASLSLCSAALQWSTRVLRNLQLLIVVRAGGRS